MDHQMKKIILTSIFVLLATQAMALTGIEKADNRCKVEVNLYMEHTTGAQKVTYPATRFTSQNSNAYFIHYKQDLKAIAHFKDGSTLPLDIRCTIEKNTFETLFVNVNGKVIPLK